MVKSLSTNGIAKRLSSVGNTLTHDERRESLTNLQKWIKANPRYVPTLWRLCVSGTVSLLEKQSHREMIPDCNNRYHSLSKTIKVKWLKKALGLDGSDYKKVEEKNGCDKLFYYTLCEHPDTDIEADYVDELMWEFAARHAVVGRRARLLKFATDGSIDWQTSGVWRLEKGDSPDCWTEIIHRPTGQKVLYGWGGRAGRVAYNQCMHLASEFSPGPAKRRWDRLENFGIRQRMAAHGMISLAA